MAIQTSFTDLQLARIQFHMGYTDNDFSTWLQFEQNLRLKDGISPQQFFQSVGNAVEDPPQADRYLFLGEDLCQTGSALYKCEIAYNQLDAQVIDPSLAYKVVGSVTFRRDEVQSRNSMWFNTRSNLSLILGVKLKLGNSRVGY